MSNTSIQTRGIELVLSLVCKGSVVQANRFMHSRK